MDWVVFHSVPEEHNPGCIFNIVFKLVHDLIFRNITSKEGYVCIIFQFLSQVPEKIQKLFLNPIVFSVQEQYDIFWLIHFLFIVCPGQFLLVVTFLTFKVNG